MNSWRCASALFFVLFFLLDKHYPLSVCQTNRLVLLCNSDKTKSKCIEANEKREIIDRDLNAYQPACKHLQSSTTLSCSLTQSQTLAPNSLTHIYLFSLSIDDLTLQPLTYPCTITHIPASLRSASPMGRSEGHIQSITSMPYHSFPLSKFGCSFEQLLN